MRTVSRYPPPRSVPILPTHAPPPTASIWYPQGGAPRGKSTTAATSTTGSNQYNPLSKQDAEHLLGRLLQFGCLELSFGYTAYSTTAYLTLGAKAQAVLQGHVKIMVRFPPREVGCMEPAAGSGGGGGGGEGQQQGGTNKRRRVHMLSDDDEEEVS